MSRDRMRIGLVLHGPEVIDTGKAAFILSYLRKKGKVEARLGGTMGAAAIVDAQMEREIEVKRELVSEALRDLAKHSDVLYLASCSKTRKSGLAFGRIAVGRAKIRPVRPMIQVDDDFVVSWNEEGRLRAEEDAKAFGQDLIDCAHPPAAREGGWRRVHGVQPGENVWINGIVVGKAISDEVWVGSESGRLALKGIEVKQHGLEKLGNLDAQRAVIRSGSVRRTSAARRAGKLEEGEKVILVDHRAEESFFRAKGAKAAVTVGDDTTCITGSLLYRLGVPVIGIVDGDEDGICRERAAAPGSVVITLAPGNDDLVGSAVKEEIFGGRQEMETALNISQLTSKIMELCGSRIKEVRRF